MARVLTISLGWEDSVVTLKPSRSQILGFNTTVEPWCVRLLRKTWEGGVILAEHLLSPHFSAHSQKTQHSSTKENGSILDVQLSLHHDQVHALCPCICACVSFARSVLAVSLPFSVSCWLWESLKAQEDTNKKTGRKKTQVKIIMHYLLARTVFSLATADIQQCPCCHITPLSDSDLGDNRPTANPPSPFVPSVCEPSQG